MSRVFSQYTHDEQVSVLRNSANSAISGRVRLLEEKRGLEDLVFALAQNLNKARRGRPFKRESSRILKLAGLEDIS